MSFELVIVGGGNMGAALLSGLLDAGVVEPGHLAVVEPLESRRDELVERFDGVTITDSIPPCASAVLAVKPPDIPAVAAGAAAAGARRVLSVAAGVTTASIVDAVGADVAVLRTMPNTPALVGQGVSALSGAPGTKDVDLDWAENVLRGVGLVVRVDESQLDAVTGLTGSGPAYVFLVAEALMDAGVLAGLPRPIVERMVAQLLVGSSALLAERGDPAGLRAMVTSPGGTTAAGVRVLEDRAVRAAVIGAVQAATERSRELGSS
ncbi:pyrroline-5-carboxylate reductase [Ilumatobacter sp.]|uniref:pyrroline-5-carboxylate reductase n=1 Tax=Ilumatobacter sp. TaxID=1967498 RepID=UPI003AF98C56